MNAAISGALVYVPAYQMGYSAFQTSLIGLVARAIMNWIPGFAAIPEGLFGALIPLGLMYFKFGISGVGTYILVALIPAIILLALAGTIMVAGGAQKKH